MKKLLATFFATATALLVLHSTVYAQKCGFDHGLRLQENNPAFQQSRIDFENFVRQYAARAAERNNNTTTVIPVVVHVLHTGQAEGVSEATGANPVDAQIISGIDDLNQAFGHLGYYTEPNQTGFYDNQIDIQFALAQTAPDGSATNGILRHDLSSDATFANNGLVGLATNIPPAQQGRPLSEVAVGKVWTPSDYLNIWLVHKFDQGSLLGFASFPRSADGKADGVAQRADSFGRAPDPDNPPADFMLGAVTNLNGTTNHEVGHYLNLYHTFEGDSHSSGCPPVANGCGDGQGDCCGDIPPHKGSSGCANDLSNGNTCDNDGPNPYIHNFMDYSDDPCFHGFSGDQKTRMEATVASNGPRNALSTSLADAAPTGTYPIAPTTPPSVTYDGNGPSWQMGPISIDFEGTEMHSFTSFYDGGYANRVASQPTIEWNTDETYFITLTIGANSGFVPEVAAIWIDYNNDGDFDDAGEAVAASPTGPDDGVSDGETLNLEITTPAVGLVITGQRLRLRVVTDDEDKAPLNAYSTTGGGQIEDYSVRLTAVLPVEMTYFRAQLQNEDEAHLSWETATETNNEGFAIERSADGIDFEEIGFVRGNGDSETSTTYRFTDSDLAVGQYYYRLKQVDTDGASSYSGIRNVTVKSASSFEIFPNPANDVLFVDFIGEKAPVFFVFNSLGQEVRVQTSQSNNQIRFNLSQLPAGLYFLHEAKAGSVSKFVKE